MKKFNFQPVRSISLIILSMTSLYANSSQAADVYANIQKQSDLKPFAFAQKPKSDSYLAYLDEIDQEVNNTNAYRQKSQVEEAKISSTSSKNLNPQEVLQRLKSLSHSPKIR